jgi:hypothetical protein
MQSGDLYVCVHYNKSALLEYQLVATLEARYCAPQLALISGTPQHQHYCRPSYFFGLAY